MYGAAVKVGPIPVGLLFLGGESELGKKDLGRGWGLRSGKVGSYHSQQLVYTFLGGESFHSGEPIKDEKGNWMVDEKKIPLTEDDRSNIKSYKMRYFVFWNDPVKDRKKRKKAKFQRELTYDLVKQTGKTEFLVYLPKEDKKPFGYPDGFLWNVEFVAGLYGGGRFGINVGEIADFLLGFTTLDLYDDDVEGKEKTSFPGFPFPAASPSESEDED
ncbi:lipoprotein [Leptospira ryugenii]|uniref:Lipoprotein n=2 Tax=Leptospira ryugenii TaxID=1917863 RepID=A0A2P2DZJ3_9LEPT|nr:lipoprotein [Leptospira ryugenii]